MKSEDRALMRENRVGREARFSHRGLAPQFLPPHRPDDCAPG